MERMEIDANVALAGVGGLLVGGAAAGGLAWLLLRKSFQSHLDQEVAAVKDHYRSQLAAIQAEHNDALKEALSNHVSLIPEAGHPFVGRPRNDVDLAGDDGDGNFRQAAMGDTPQVAELRITDPLEGLDDGPDEPDWADDSGVSEAADSDGEGDLHGRDAAAPAAPVTRDLRKPYMISLEEFSDTPPGWRQLTITYYADDKVLVDDKNEPINPFAKVVGFINGKRDFGGVSGDPNIRYVRNQNLETDFEILYDPRSYAEAILHYGQPNRGS